MNQTYLMPHFRNAKTGEVRPDRPASKNKREAKRLEKEWREVLYGVAPSNDPAVKVLHTITHSDGRVEAMKPEKRKRGRGQPKKDPSLNRGGFWAKELYSVRAAVREVLGKRAPTNEAWAAFTSEGGPWFRLTAIAADPQSLDPISPAEPISANAIANSHRSHLARSIARDPIFVPLFFALMRLQIVKMDPLLLWLHFKGDRDRFSNEQLIAAYPGKPVSKDQMRKALAELNSRLKPKTKVVFHSAALRLKLAELTPRLKTQTGVKVGHYSL